MKIYQLREVIAHGNVKCVNSAKYPTEEPKKYVKNGVWTEYQNGTVIRAQWFTNGVDDTYVGKTLEERENNKKFKRQMNEAETKRQEVRKKRNLKLKEKRQKEGN